MTGVATVAGTLLEGGLEADAPAGPGLGLPKPCFYPTTDTHIILRSDDYGATWDPWFEGGSGNLADLADVDLTGLADADGIFYDLASGLWKPGPLAAGSTSPRTKIADVLLASVAASVDFTSIPGTYDDLELVFYGKHATSTGAVSIRLTINNDTTDANYKRSYQYADSGGGSGGANVADRVTAQVNGTGPTLAKWVIPRYPDTTFQKVYGSEVVNSGTSLVQYGSLWANTAAITRLTLTFIDGTNFAVGTRVRLYGLKDV